MKSKKSILVVGLAITNIISIIVVIVSITKVQIDNNNYSKAITVQSYAATEKQHKYIEQYLTK